MIAIPSETTILDQLWACRERDLIRKIAVGSDLDFDLLLIKYGNESARCFVENVVENVVEKVLPLENVLEKVLPLEKRVRVNNIPESERCMARVWNGGKGGRCTRRGGKGDGGDLCGNHFHCLEEKGVLPQGRIDSVLPENMSSVVGIVVKDMELDMKLDTELNHLLIEKSQENSLLEEIPGENSSTLSGKSRRGRPKGRKNSKTDENESFDSEGDVLEEEELNTCVSKGDITDCMRDYLCGAVLTDVTYMTAKKAIEKKLSIKSFASDKKWFKTTFDSMKSDMVEKAMAEKALTEKALTEKVLVEKALTEKDSVEKELTEKVVEKVLVEKAVAEIIEDDDNSEEVSCQEINVSGVVYLLDKESMKIYARDVPNDFVGKYDGSNIDFDADDSDADSDDE